MKKIDDILNTIILNDCIAEMKTWPENSCDAMVTDPPAGISMMGQAWDTFDRTMFGIKGQEGANDLKVKKNFKILPRYGNADLMGFQDFICAAFTEAIRVLKPGGHALVWAIPRTSHHTAMGLERAGFEVRDIVSHIFSTGFPKSLNVAKAINSTLKTGGSAPKNLRQDRMGNEYEPTGQKDYHKGRMFSSDIENDNHSADLCPEAHEWAGWGTALKPASEHWILCRKPLSEKTVAENVLKYGTGGINIDACRVFGAEPHHNYGRTSGDKSFVGKSDNPYNTPLSGRFPANLVLTCICDEIIIEPTETKESEEVKGGIFRPSQGKPGGRTYKGGNIIHTNPDCPCYMLDKMSGAKSLLGKRIEYTLPIRRIKPTKNDTSRENAIQFSKYKNQFNYQDTGGASRYFYCAKASKSERNLGCENMPEKNPCYETHRPNYKNTKGIETPFAGTGRSGKNLKNNHPTVKNISLMKYLCRMICPSGGIVLDPFAGSGSTLIAAKLEGFNFIGIEKDSGYAGIAQARLKAWKCQKQENLF